MDHAENRQALWDQRMSAVRVAPIFNELVVRYVRWKYLHHPELTHVNVRRVLVYATPEERAAIETTFLLMTGQLLGGAAVSPDAAVMPLFEELDRACRARETPELNIRFTFGAGRAR